MTVALAATAWPVDVGRALREGFHMFWVTLWPLILGFTLSGMVQAFVSRRSVRERLGDARPAAVARASGYGMVSSSCSYAASAMAKSLFVKGADFVATAVFMFASTNLVVELGIVLTVLMGWQFAVGEFVGGAIMIVLLATFGGLWLRGRLVTRARARLQAAEDDRGTRPHEETALLALPWRRRLRSPGGWADAATYTMADLTMVRRELFVGYAVAGVLATVVPADLWNSVFFRGHGCWTSVENAVVGPLIAVVSFVCSIGNVPLAAALWRGGISFGGVVSFLFADLITVPLLLVYRRYYGTRLMLRMMALFWAVMSAAGLATGLLCSAAGLVPVDRRTGVAPASPGWNLTTVLNLVFLAVLAVLYRTYRHRDRLGGGRGRARDPVCGMQVEVASAPASVVHGGTVHSFCSDRCLGRFTDDPGAFGGHPDLRRSGPSGGGQRVPKAANAAPMVGKMASAPRSSVSP